MRLVETSLRLTDTILGKAIYNEKGNVLLNEGVQLNRYLINRLLEMGVNYVYIEDVRTQDIKLQDSLPTALKQKALKSIQEHFVEFENSQYIAHSLVLEKATKELTSLIREIKLVIKDNRDLLMLLADVCSYDSYIFTHSLNVSMYSLAIGMKLNLNEKKLEMLGLGAILHDVGKMTIPEEILLKPGRLTAVEFAEVKKHAEAGFELLRHIPTISLIVAHCAYQHHERLDGSGYPRGLKENEIHLFGKIIAIADVFDAVTSNRIYRRAMLPHQGLEILYAGSGTLYDQKLIQTFRQAVAVYPIGLTVVLSDGRKGVVSNQNVGLGDRPIIRILEENGEDIPPYELDLKAEMDVMITACDTTFEIISKNENRAAPS